MSDQVNRVLHAAAHDVAMTLVSQPDLFPPVTPEGAPLLSPANAVRRVPSGKILAQDEERCLLVAALRELGLSDRKISSMTGVARESIGPILMRMERAGKVRPLRKGCWERWNMEPVSETSACVLMIAREWSEATLQRRVVEVAPCPEQGMA